jgi:ADP-ribose pyrophosphatase YjhB (NUDIX family)
VGFVEHIHIAAAAGEPTASLREASVRAGIGFVGDRYAAGAGYWRDNRVSRDVTLIEGEIVDGLVKNGLVLEPGELRRNLTTRGISLNDLLGRVFWVGDVLCRGTELCEPCRHLEELTHKQLLRPLLHRGGLRAQLLLDGTIRVGDSIKPVEELDGVGVLVRRDDRVLLGRRVSPHGFGTWSFPGGKALYGESFVDCALRELREETGLEGGRGRVIAETVDGFPESRLVFRTRFVEVDDAVGEPELREPEKASEWRWWSWPQLPKPLFAPVASLLTTPYEPHD